MDGEANVKSDNLTFSQALVELKNGRRVGRKSWKNAVHVFLVEGSTFEVNRAPLNKYYDEGTKIKYHAHIDVMLIDRTIGTWSPSNEDVLADDWFFKL